MATLNREIEKAPDLDRMTPAERDAWLVAERNKVRDSWPPSVERVKRGERADGLTVIYQDKGRSKWQKGEVRI